MADHETVEALVKKNVLAATTTDLFNYQFKGDDEHLRRHPGRFKQDPHKPMTLQRASMEAAP